MDSSIHNQLIAQIKKRKKGTILFPADFKGHLSAVAIRQTLSRLTKEGMLKRLAQGVYLYPQEDPALGTLYPSTDEIAQAIAKRDKVRILPAGLYALNKLGLSTQVPMKVVYLTDGKPKTIKAGKRTITFITSTPKKLSLKGKWSSLAIQALEVIGKNGITPEITSQIATVLRNENIKTIQEDAKLAPDWIARLLLSMSKQEEQAT